MSRRKTTKEFQQEVQNLGGGYYKLCSDYKDSHSKVKLFHTVCEKHYNVSPTSFLGGTRCPYCAGRMKNTTENFKEEVKALTGEDYTVLGDYKNANTKINIKHNKCGHIWKITPNKFLHGRRCPRCNESHGERAIRKYLDSNNIQYESQKRFKGCRYKKPLPFDFYLPTLRIVIEYDGEQHFKPFDHFGGKKRLKLYKKRDSIKNSYCLENNIKLIRINYQIDSNSIDEFLDKLIKGGY